MIFRRDPPKVSGTFVKQNEKLVRKSASNFWGVLAEHLEKRVIKYFRYLKRARLDDKKENNQLLATFQGDPCQL